MKLINEQEIFSRWSPILESEVGISDRSKLQWMSKYCHNHELYENQTQATLNSVNGMGATRFPDHPGSQQSFINQRPGSGDKAHTLLPLAMQIAGSTIGLDLVPVVPMPGPMGVLTYLDFVYGGGKLNGKGVDVPLMIQATFADYPGTPGDEQTENGATFTYLGKSRLSGKPIFKVKTDATYNGTLSEDLEIAFTGATGFDGATGLDVDLVKALEDHITGFSGSAFLNDIYETNEDQSINDPYSRELGEETNLNVMNLKLFNKSVEAKTYQLAAAVTWEQVQDLKQFGIDAVTQVQTVLLEEVSQSIDKNILDRMFALGERNHENIIKSQGTNFFLNIGSTAVDVSATTSNVQTSFGSYINSPYLRSVTMNPTEVVNSSSENFHSRQRKIISKILAIANMIDIRGRRGPGTFVVTNGQVATALQDVSGFSAAPMANSISQVAGNLRPIGSIAGLSVYNNSKMPWNDTRVLVGRKGDGNSPGLVYMPYILADTVQTIAEDTLAPKIGIKSRYALVEAGFHPETMYLTSGVFIDPALNALV